MSQLPPPMEPLGYATYLPPPKPRPTSVTVIAVFGFIIGGLGLLGGICSLPQYLGVSFGPNPVMDNIRRDAVLQTFTIGSLVLGVILAIWLLWAASGLMSLKPAARTSIKWYAIIYLAISVVSQILNLIVINPRMQQATQSAMKGNPMFNTPAMKAVMQYSMYGGVCFAVVFLAWPISILYVMSLPHVKAAFEKAGSV